MDEYRELAAKYLKERDYYKELHRTARIEADGYRQCLENKDTDLTQTKQLVPLLLEALKKYGDHYSSCAVRWSVDDPKYSPCDCGLEAAIA